MSHAENAMQVKPPDELTVKSLRAYLDEMESLWTEMDTGYMGEFENHKINCMYHGDKPGIGQGKIIYDGGLDFIVLPANE